ncbi:hypothetical protein C5O22_02945 [Treponema sp. J25]|nr:hypothetical protein C5O22_02945 [Treponema sp. J25]
MGKTDVERVFGGRSPCPRSIFDNLLFSLYPLLWVVYLTDGERSLKEEWVSKEQGRKKDGTVLKDSLAVLILCCREAVLWR